MFEEMAIGVKMGLTGNPTQQLEKFTTVVKAATEATEAFEKMLSLVNKNFLKSAEILTKLNPAFKEFNSSIALSSSNTKGLNSAFSGLNRRLDGMSERMTNITRKATVLTEELEGVTAATGAASLAATAGFGAAGFAAGRAGGHGGGIHFKGMDFGSLAFTGGALAVGAAAMLTKSGYEASKEYQQVLAQISLQNIPGTDSNQINQFVNSQNIPGVSKLDLLQKFQDALVVNKNIGESEGLAPFLAKIGLANKIFAGTKQELRDQDFYALVKSAEILTGSMDPAVLKPVIDEMVKVNNATSGQVKPTQSLQMLQKTRGVLRGADPKLLYQLEPIEQEYGGAATGVMVRAFYQHLQAGRLTTASAMQLEKMGLIKPGFAEYNKIGMIKRIKPGGVVDQKLLNSNFIDWYNKYFISYFKKNHLSEQQEKMINSVTFTNSDLALANTLVQQQAKIAKTAELNAHALGTNDTLKKMPAQTAAEQKLAASYYNFRKAIGDLASPAILSGLDATSKTLEAFTAAIVKIQQVINEKHPWLDKIAGWFDPTINNHGSQPQQHASSSGNASQPNYIQIVMDGRQVAHAVTPHLNQGIYLGQVQSPNRFNPSITPSVVGTSSPYGS